MNKSSEKNWAIVDDDTIFQYSIRRIIQSVDSNIRVTSYFDGAEFLAFLKSHDESESELPSDVLMDINMPLLDGWSFIEEIEKMNLVESLPFRLHIMTSSISPEDRKRYDEKDFLGMYIVKPIDDKVIQQIINQPSLK
jgi:CheY-like chemotaxis protein